MARRQVSIFINGKEIANNIKAIAGEKRKVVRELNRMTIGTKEYNDKLKELERLNGVLNTHRTRVRGISSSYDKITAGAKKFLGIAATAFAADKVLEYGKELFNTAVEMDTLERKALTVLGPALDTVKESALENANAMGLTTSQYTDAATAIADVLIPMKFQREEAAQISTQLVDLSGALSEWTGGQRSATDVADILKKALTGEREQLKELGIVIQEADVKARLAEKGLKGLTGEMLQQAKAAATLELITEKSLDAQSSFADNSDSLIRRQAELSAKIQDVTEKLAIAFLPVFERLLEIANAAADGVQSFGIAISELSDPVSAATGAFERQNQSVTKLEKELTPLLSRYEELTNKSELSKKEQDELKEVIKKIGEVTPTAITEIDEYGNALSINAGKSRDFLEAEKARLKFINEESIGSLEAEIQGMISARDALVKAVESGRGGAFNLYEYSAAEIGEFNKEIAEYTTRIKGAQAELNRLTGDNLDTPGTPNTDSNSNTSSGNNDDSLKEAARLQRIEDERKKAAEREAKNLEKRLQRLKEIRERFEEDARLVALTDDERRLAEVRASFDKQIEIAKELEAKGVKEATAQRVELERLRDNELQRVRQQIFTANLEAENLRLEEEERLKDEKYEARLLKEQERAAAEREARTLIETELLSEQDMALQELDIHYQTLIDLAEKYGLDTAEITAKWNEEKAKLNKEYREKETAEVLKEQQQRAQAQAQAFASLADIAGSALELLGDESSKFAELQRIITLAQLGFKSAEAIANATASAAALPFPGNLAAIAAAVATVLTNMAQAKKAFESAPSVPQRRDGGYANVKGAQDGITYKARYIGDPSTGMLPPGPVLTGSGILANEAGQEYFVSNKDLQKPAVANYVRMIENIRMNRVPQRIDGGFGQQDPNQTQEQQVPESSMMSSQLIAVLSQLNATIQQGIIARYDEDEVLKVFDVFQKLDDASGNTLN